MMAAAAQSPRRAGEGTALPGEGSTPPPEPHEVGDRTAQEGAQTPGPCPHCGHPGPRIILCHNADCLHERSMHNIGKGDVRGACSVSYGPKATRCTCQSFIPNPEATQ